MTNQEAFTRMVQHLRHQGRQSVNEHGCRYRAPNGDRCAVGVLITDEFYHPLLEGGEVGDIVVQSVLKKALPKVSIDLLQLMQQVHDLCTPGEWEDCWYEVAYVFDLTVPDHDEIPSTALELQGERATCPSTK